jgi:hypothetical protein
MGIRIMKPVIASSSGRSGTVMARRRHGYILLAVLGIATMATTLGLGFLDANSTVMPEAMNQFGMVRAQYLADSGVSMATHYLTYLPTSVPLDLNSYWAGTTNVSLDGGVDTFNVSVVRSDAWTPALTDLNQYRITSTSTAKDGDGAVRAKRTVTADVIAVPKGVWMIPQALIDKSSLTVATPLPSTDTSRYLSYTIQGRSCSSYLTFLGPDITSSNAATLNGIDMSANNPGRIIRFPAGNIKLKANANITGCPVVIGRLELDDAASRTITAMPGFPALIVTGDLRVMQDNVTFTVNGPVICGGRIDNNNKNNAILTFNGPVIVQDGVTGQKLNTVVNYNYTQSRAAFWDFDGTAPVRPVTILNWNES